MKIMFRVNDIKQKGLVITDEEEDRIKDIIEQVLYIFSIQDVIVYQILDSIDNNDIYSENDIVEIFIRANSGGTILEKSDLLFALLTVSMEDIEEKGTLDFDSLKCIFRNRNKSIDITEDNILSAGYTNENSKRKLYLLFNIWYEQFNFNPSFIESSPNIDHIFPQSLLKSIKIKGDKGRLVQKYKSDSINQLANCKLITLKENQMGGKGNITPSEWFEKRDNKYLDMHLIPKDKELWKIENYEKFIEVRKKMIIDKFLDILI